MIRKMNMFLPVAGDTSLSAEFDCFHPNEDFAKGEARGFKSYMGKVPNLPFIKAEKSLPPADLPKMIEYMIHHSWQSSKKPTTQRSGLVIGAGLRQAANVVDAARTVARPVSPHAPVDNKPHLSQIATDWKLMGRQLRVNAYAFRGDSRSPVDIKQANGFQPPNTRTDQRYVDGTVYKGFSSYMERRYGITVSLQTFQKAYAGAATSEHEREMVHNYFIWRTLSDNEALHLGRMLACEDLKGYTSTTRSLVVAKGYAKPDGWAYVTLVRGGYLVLAKKATAWTSIFGEQEIALPGPIKWTKVFGFRKVDEPSGKFVGPVYLRNNFEARNPDAFKECHELMSGRSQEPA